MDRREAPRYRLTERGFLGNVCHVLTRTCHILTRACYILTRDRHGLPRFGRKILTDQLAADIV
jgi:hypothetical protein